MEEIILNNMKQKQMKIKMRKKIMKLIIIMNKLIAKKKLKIIMIIK